MGQKMANLLGRIWGSLSLRSQPASRKLGYDCEGQGEGDASMGVEAAFSPTQPATLLAHSTPAALDTDWAISRLNNRSVR